MAIQNLGYRPIRELKTPADYKLLNDTLRSLWIKVLGNISSKDINGEISAELSGTFGKQVSMLDGRVTEMERMDAEQNGRLLLLETWKAEVQPKIKALEAWKAEMQPKIEALEAWKAEMQPKIEALEAWKAEMQPKIETLEAWKAEMQPKIEALEARVKALEGGV